MFSCTKCVIRKEKTGKRVVGVRTCSNVYYINDRKESKFFQ